MIECSPKIIKERAPQRCRGKVIMSEKDIIREAVRKEWDKLSEITNDSEGTKIQRARWVVLDDLWNTLYDEEY